MSRPLRLGTAAGALVVLLMAPVRSDAQPLLGPSRHFGGFFAATDGGRSGERLGTIAASWLAGGGQIYVRIHNLRWPLSLLP